MALCHAQLISSFVLSLSWKTARSLDFRKLFPAVLFFPLSFFLGTCFDLETPTGFEWFVRDPASIKRLLRTIERLYLTNVFKNPLSFIEMVIPRGGSKRMEIHPAGGRERERRESDEIDIQGTRSNLRKFTIREESTRAELTLLVGRGGLNEVSLLGGRLYRSPSGLKRPPWYLLLPSILSFRPRGVFALSFFLIFLHQPTPFPCPSNSISLFLFFNVD